MLYIMFVVSVLGILVYMFFIFNEHILVFLSICIVSSSVIRVLESCMFVVAIGGYVVVLLCVLLVHFSN
jgi:hypothetical protein